jgi:hypothetical protein
LKTKNNPFSRTQAIFATKAATSLAEEVDTD